MIIVRKINFRSGIPIARRSKLIGHETGKKLKQYRNGDYLRRRAGNDCYCTPLYSMMLNHRSCDTEKHVKKHVKQNRTLHATCIKLERSRTHQVLNGEIFTNAQQAWTIHRHWCRLYRLLLDGITVLLLLLGPSIVTHSQLCVFTTNKFCAVIEQQ